jgi:hypothetical protein
MATFNGLVNIQVNVNASVTVEAETREKAIEMAKEMALAEFRAKYPDICNAAYLVTTNLTGIRQLGVRRR